MSLGGTHHLERRCFIILIGGAYTHVGWAVPAILMGSAHYFQGQRPPGGTADEALRHEPPPVGGGGHPAPDQAHGPRRGAHSRPFHAGALNVRHRICQANSSRCGIVLLLSSEV